MRTNREFHKSICGSATTFYLADLHVHTPASADVSQGERLAAISPEFKDDLAEIARLGLSPTDHERKVMEAYPPSRFLKDIVRTRDRIAQANGIGEGYDWAVLGLTDHNICAYSCEVARLAWSERPSNKLYVLPGIELDVRYTVDDESEAVAHILCLFRPGLSESDIRIVVHEAIGNGWEPGDGIVTDSLPSFVQALRNHDDYPAICIAAHVATESGVRGGTRNAILSRLDVGIARVQQELEHGADPDLVVLSARLEDLQSQRTADEEISLSCLKLIGDCGFDALQIASQEDEVHYRYLHRYKPSFGRAVPIIASDAHSPDDTFQCGGGTPYLKLKSASSQVSELKLFEEVRNALRLGETRFNFMSPGTVQSWISGIEITPDSDEAARFWPCSSADDSDESFNLPLSRNLNAFVGGRGAGKSAAIEALSFVCNPSEYDAVDPRKLPEWYTRAEATLVGCSVRLCIQFLGSDTNNNLPKKALFAQRHFSSQGGFEPVHFSDIDDHELLSDQIPPIPVNVYRLGDIERHSGPGKLRALFDAICGPEVRELEEDIRQKKEGLLDQRREMVDLAGRLAALTTADAPLRNYIHRHELLAEVDRPEVKEAYERIDQLDAAWRLALSAKSGWEEKEGAFKIEENVAAIRLFFEKYRLAAVSDNGDVALDIEPLVKLIGKNSEVAERAGGKYRGIAEAAGALKERLNSVDEGLSRWNEGVELALREARDSLQVHGLPSGGKDREAKKKALEDAQEALTLYRELLEAWRTAEISRSAGVEELWNLVNERSELRNNTATYITNKLRRDLDGDILVIEADARSQTDTSEFRRWLESHFSDRSFRFRDKRISALLEKNLSPASLRKLLADTAAEDLSLLEIALPASEGGIDNGIARTLYEKCLAVNALSPEKNEAEVEKAVWDACPEEIRNGLFEFPADSDGLLNVDSALELDEVIFDDEPVIMLNDRPPDIGSVLRPLENLSPGQRCSAILPILLLTGKGPLIIDQPEDNLDNRLIRQVIVNILASIKLRRQVIVATHNPNVPVLGDVENAVALRGVRDHECAVDVAGNLDDEEVVHQLTEVMEGGREAFQYRQTIYQLHWSDSVAQNELNETSG